MIVLFAEMNIILLLNEYKDIDVHVNKSVVKTTVAKDAAKQLSKIFYLPA